MRYIVPAVLAGLLFTGCASSQCKTHQEGEPEPAPAVQAGQIPFLGDIPLLGHMFRNEPLPEQPLEEEVVESEPVDPKMAAAVPLLGDIPLLGHLFKRVDSSDSESTPSSD